MKERYEIKCAVFLILTKIIAGKQYILLQRRYNTGFADGKYDLACSGHLEEGESIRIALIRETKEEIGITISEKNLKLINIMHADFKDTNYIMASFEGLDYDGQPKIMEPHKCDDLTWFEIDNLPNNIIESRLQIIKDYLNKNNYTEVGF